MNEFWNKIANIDCKTEKKKRLLVLDEANISVSYIICPIVVTKLLISVPEQD